MKKIIIVFTAFISISIMSCQKQENPQQDDSILPESFSVDIPSSISRKSSTRSMVDTLNGNEIYKHLSTFIHVGEGASVLVQSIILHIAYYRINKPMSLSYTSKEDGRVKNLEVIENASYNGEDWEFQLTVTDAESEINADGGKAMQIFWNRNPVKGIAILKPYNIDRTDNANAPDAMFRIDYSEAGELGYDKHMIVSISGLPLANPLDDPYSMKKLKMFAGRKGNVVDVYGNSDHPNAKFFTNKTGYDWAFVASGKRTEDIGVAEVGLPSDSLDASERKVILEDHSIKNVFTDEIYTAWPNIDSASVEEYLHNTTAPGFFDNKGFVQGGTAPGPGYDDLLPRIQDMTPYNPIEISTLSLSFK